jgi:hypothetical protein
MRDTATGFDALCLEDGSPLIKRAIPVLCAHALRDGGLHGGGLRGGRPARYTAAQNG